MDTMRLLQPRDEVVTKKVIDQFDVDIIYFTKSVNVEVTRGGRGDVYINGVCFVGARLIRYEEKHRYLYAPNEINVEIGLPYGELKLTVQQLKITEGHIPTTARLVGTLDADTLKPFERIDQ